MDRAPVGMSRQKDNLTRYLPKSKRIMWVVEWIDVDGQKRLSEVLESSSIGEAYRVLVTEKERESKKRKRGEGIEDATPTTTESTKTVAKVERDEEEKVETMETPLQTEPKTAQISDCKIASDSKYISNTTTPNPPQPDTPCLHFYLQKPHTPSTSRVLIPLRTSDSLTASLKDRVVLEYPTIYALTHGPDTLPAGFVTAEEYLAGAKKDNPEFAEVMDVAPGARRAVLEGGIFGHAGRLTRKEPEEEEESSKNMDPAAILDMLRRDIGA